jgi:SGNH domain-containing protein
MLEKGVNSLSSDRLSHGKIIWKPASCVLSSNSDVGKEISFQSCTVPDIKRNERRLLVIGNSFSAAEFDMFIAAPGSGLGSVTITSSWGASPVPEVSGPSPYYEANSYYWSSVIPSMTSELRRGDVLIMANDMAGFSSQSATKGHTQMLDALQTGLSRIAQDMESRGVAVIFQTAIPYMREAGCTPDMAVSQWFKLKGPSCKYFTRDYTEKRRSALQAMLLDIHAKHRNFYILDLLDVFCPAEVCSFNGQNGEFLYRDEWSHPSVEANGLARPIFLSVLQRAVAETFGDAKASPNPN